MSWDDMSLNCFKAAQSLRKLKNNRSCVNRSYYAAFSAVTHEMRKITHVFPSGYEHPPHKEMSKKVKQISPNLNLTSYERAELVLILKRLYKAREDADYRNQTIIDDVLAKSCLRDAEVALTLLGLHP